MRKIRTQGLVQGFAGFRLQGPLQGLGFIGLVGFIGFLGFIGFIGFRVCSFYDEQGSSALRVGS